jgi:hypothetical protein
MSRIRRLCWLMLIACAAPLASCGLFPTGCNLVGCVNALSVEIENAPAGPITVQARVPNSSDSALTASCPGASGCTNRVSFPNFLPSEVQLTITTTQGTRTQVASPAYQTSKPNGDRCDPTCRNGEVRIRW